MAVVVGVSVLAIATVVLSVFALTQHRGAGDARPASSASSSPAPSASAGPTEPAATPEPAPAALVAPTRALAAQDANRVYRVGTGACPDPRASFELSTDGGATWQASDIADRTGSSAALSISMGGPEFIQMVTLRTSDCAPQYIRSFVGGIDWEVFDADLPYSWYFNPADPSMVHTPNGDRPTPCTAVAVAATGSRAAVLCSDSTLHTTGDSADTWGAAIPVAHAAAIGVSPNGFHVAVLDADGCSGVQLGEVIADGMPALGACLPAVAAQAEVAVATSGDGTTFVWAGDAFARSGDGGATW